MGTRLSLSIGIIILAYIVKTASILLIGIISVHVFALHLVFIVQKLYEKVRLIPHLLDMITKLTPILPGSR